MAREGIPFLIVCVLVGTLFFATGHPRVAGFFIIPFLFIAFFFRDPVRLPPTGGDLIVSPADGKVIAIENVDQSPIGDKATKISIFLSIFNVHINRAPVPGKIERIEYKPGHFFVASNARASEQNERNTFFIDSPHGKIAFSQVAGIIARRIVCWKKEKDSVTIGEKVGMIMFGSRVDLFLPEAVVPAVRIGDSVAGGTSIIGRVERKETAVGVESHR